MEKRAGCAVQAVAKKSMEAAAVEAFAAEMDDITALEEKSARMTMIDMDDELGVGVIDPTDPAR